MFCRWVRIFFVLASMLFSSVAMSDGIAPKISIIIDDMGNTPMGWQVVNLPGPVVCSILPDTPLSRALAVACHQRDKEVILHTPMQAIMNHHLGPGGLYLGMPKAAFEMTLTQDLQSIPYVQGLNNHMGSRLTQSAIAMSWVMETVKPYHYFYIDSFTTPNSVAFYMARCFGVTSAKRNIFLDDIRTPRAVAEQFRELVALAKLHGSAIAIGHPYPVTLHFLASVLPYLAKEGVELVPVSALAQSAPIPQILPNSNLALNLEEKAPVVAVSVKVPKVNMISTTFADILFFSLQNVVGFSNGNDKRIVNYLKIKRH